jgi:hypothetical protein
LRLVRWWIWAWVAAETWRKFWHRPLTMAELTDTLKQVWTDGRLESQLYGHSLLDWIERGYWELVNEPPDPRVVSIPLHAEDRDDTWPPLQGQPIPYDPGLGTPTWDDRPLHPSLRPFLERGPATGPSPAGGNP